MPPIMRLFDVVEKVVKNLMLLLLAGMVVLISMQVGFRYILNRPLAWTEEVARHLLIWAALLGTALAYRRRGHLGMDVLVLQLSKTWQRRIEGIVHLLSAAFFGVLFFNGIPLVERTMHQLSSAIRIPMGYIYASVPAGSALVVLFAIEKLVRLYAGPDVPDAPNG